MVLDVIDVTMQWTIWFHSYTHVTVMKYFVLSLYKLKCKLLQLKFKLKVTSLVTYSVQLIGI